jgi:hypothetical protein
MTTLKKVTTIYTHGGVFHADEVSAIALLEVLLDAQLNVIRGFQLPEELPEGAIMVDIGRRYDNQKHFDHHQDAALVASNTLVLNKCLEEGLITEFEYKWLWPLFEEISEVDCGRAQAGKTGINSLIKAFNRPDPAKTQASFEAAMMTMRFILAAQIDSARAAAKDAERWEALPLLRSRVKLQEQGAPIITWRELAETENVWGLIVHDSARGQWNLISRDSEEFHIPADCQGAKFVHNSGFMASFQSMDDAIEAAEICLARWAIL